jgi:hypothetical protein
MPFYPLQVRSVAAADPSRWSWPEELAAQCQIHDRKERIRPSVRPFTIADHLLTFCHPREWTKGLMFHEYHVIPESFKELRNKIRAKYSQLRIPPLDPSNAERPKMQKRSS